MEPVRMLAAGLIGGQTLVAPLRTSIRTHDLAERFGLSSACRRDRRIEVVVVYSAYPGQPKAKPPHPAERQDGGQADAVRDIRAPG
jgi:hypothetical protein